jgi:hypothetical protein
MNIVVISGVDNWVPVTGRAHADVAVTATATALNALHASTRKVLLTVETAAVRITFDGSTPTTEHGHRFAAGSVLQISRRMAQRLKVVRATSTSATITVTECEFGNGARG